jgi:tetratricopeptide (TPR) repeat protein
MRSLRSSFRVGAFVSVILATSAVQAQQSEADKLFAEGEALMKQNKFGEACPKFEASNKIDPQIGGYLWLADCFERNGQTASAYKTYKDAQKMALEKKDKQQRDKVAQKHIATIESHLTKLTILAPSENKPDALEISRDGEKLGASDLGLAVPLDPGMHTVTATAPHHKTWEKKIDVSGDGNTVTVTVGPLEREDAAAPPPPPEEGDPGFGYHVGGIVVGAAGLIAIGVGSALGLVAAGKLSDSNSNGYCDAQDTCNTIGLDLRQQAKDAALVSTILFIGGGVALAAGITLFVIAPKKKHAATIAHIAPTVGPGFYGFSLGGSF